MTASSYDPTPYKTPIYSSAQKVLLLDTTKSELLEGLLAKLVRNEELRVNYWDDTPQWWVDARSINKDGTLGDWVRLAEIPLDSKGIPCSFIMYDNPRLVTDPQELLEVAERCKYKK